MVTTSVPQRNTFENILLQSGIQGKTGNCILRRNSDPILGTTVQVGQDAEELK